MSDLGGVSIERNVPASMPDGVRLMADIYRPTRPGQYPVLLQRSPYDKRYAQTVVYQHPAWYARQGYVVAVQDVRGRFASEGYFRPYRDDAADGAATIQWAAGLDGTTGKVGTYGFSYAGANQLQAAGRTPEALACASVAFAGSDYFDGWSYRGGALHLAFLLSWTIEALAIPDALREGDKALAGRIRNAARDLCALYATPLGELTETGLLPAYFFDWLAHDKDDDYWRAVAPSTFYDSIAAPCLHIGGWYDIFLTGTLANFAALGGRAGADSGRHRLVIGPWQHVPWSRMNGELDYGAAGDNRIDLLQLRWFNRWLKDRPLDDAVPLVSYFLMGANEWVAEEAWPPADTVARELFLRSDGRAASLSGSGTLSKDAPADEPPDLFMFHPANPVPSLGGASCCRAEVAPIGAFDQREVEIRNDILVYTAPTLDHGIDVVGPVDVVLHAASDAPDTDWTAKLVDVHPDGRAINVCDGILRASYAASLARPEPIPAGMVAELVISLGATAIRFGRGHSIRLEISSSSFPLHDVNPNTGAHGMCADPWSLNVATQTVFHDRARPSRLRFRVRRPRDAS